MVPYIVQIRTTVYGMGAIVDPKYFVVVVGGPALGGQEKINGKLLGNVETATKNSVEIRLRNGVFQGWRAEFLGLVNPNVTGGISIVIISTSRI
jgi:hypothetical protein